MLTLPEPVIVVPLFPELHDALLNLLNGLTPAEWARPTVCQNWSVKDVVAHLLAGDVGILSRKRDQHFPPNSAINSWEDLVLLINRLNAEWTTAMRRVSPRVMVDLLSSTGPQVSEYFASLDPHTMGGPVDWAGSGPAPVWLDLAREYTERWHHQQQIRDAVNKPGMKSPRYLQPILETFVRAIPHTFRDSKFPARTSIVLAVTGECAAAWSVVKEEGVWQLYRGLIDEPTAQITIGEDALWRLFTKAISPDDAIKHFLSRGNDDLVRTLLETIAIIG